MKACKAWLELARISNLPTVISNVIAGAVVGAICFHLTAAEATNALFTPSLAWLSLSIPCIVYSAGMMLNDACDANIDAKERPHRPIPSARVTRTTVFVVGFALLALAIALALLTRSPHVLNATIALVIIVLLYDFLHALHWSSVILLAIARALASLIPMLAFAQSESSSIFTSAAIALPIALAAWTLALSILARTEVSATRMLAQPRTIGWLIACFALIDMTAMRIVSAWIPAVLCAALFFLTRASQRVIAGS